MTTLNITTGSITIDGPIGGGMSGVAYFTASAIWTVPSGVTKVRVIAVGGGGGGAASTTGGGGGGYAEDIISVDGFATLPVTVGLGGNAGGGTGDNGGNSGLLFITASGGIGGTGNGTVVAGGTGISASISGKGGSGGNENGGGMPGTVPWAPVPITSSIYLPRLQATPGAGGWGDGIKGNSGSVVIYY